MNRKHEIEKYLIPLLPEEPEEITATALQREYTNGFLAGQKKAYNECDEVARELSQIKSGCSKWLDKHDAKIRADVIDECKQMLLDVMVRDGNTKCHEYMVAFNEMEQLKEKKNGKC